MSALTPKEHPFNILRSLQKSASDPVEKEFFTRTYINGENTEAVLKDMNLSDAYVDMVVTNIARQSRKSAQGAGNV